MALGGIIGGILGSAVGGPLGASIGTGLGQAAQGAFQKKKAKGMSVAPINPMDQAMFNRLKRQSDAAATGTKYNPQMVAGQQMAKSMQRNAMNAGSPANMGVYSNLLSQTMQNIQEMTSRDIAQTNAQLGEQTARISDISRDTKLLEQNKMEADAAENQKAGFQNLAGGLMPKGKFKYNDGLKIQEILDPTKKKKKPGEVDLDVEGTEEGEG
jgi:hypothetical protein